MLNTNLIIFTFAKRESVTKQLVNHLKIESVMKLLFLCYLFMDLRFDGLICMIDLRIVYMTYFMDLLHLNTN